MLGFSGATINSKIEGSRSCRFDDRAKLITSGPNVLGLDSGTTKVKLEGMRSRGFVDPLALATSAPQLLVIGFENIDRKIRLLARLRRDRGKAIEEIAAFSTLLGYR